jgi:CRP-like cAMP-binding protein
VETLRRHPFTKGIPEPLLKKLSSISHEVDFDEDEIVFRAGERHSYFGLLVCGSVCVELRTEFYGMTIENLSAGEAFGWSSLLDEHHTVFQVRAREPASAIYLDGPGLRELCANDPKLGAEMYRRLAEMMAKRIRSTELRLAEFCGPARCDPTKSAEIEAQT